MSERRDMAEFQEAEFHLIALHGRAKRAEDEVERLRGALEEIRNMKGAAVDLEWWRDKARAALHPEPQPPDENEAVPLRGTMEGVGP